MVFIMTTSNELKGGTKRRGKEAIVKLTTAMFVDEDSVDSTVIATPAVGPTFDVNVHRRIVAHAF